MVKEKKTLDKSLKLLVKSSLVVFVGLVLSKLLTYGYKISVARYFGPEIYGVFSLAIMIIGWFISFASLGITDGILRYIPIYRGKKQINNIKHLIKVSSILLTITSIVAGIILFFSAEYFALTFFNSKELVTFLKYFSIIIPFYILATFYGNTIRSFEKISTFSFLTNIFQNVIKVAALFIFIWIALEANSVIFSYMLGVVSLFIGAYLFSRFKLSGILGKYYLKRDKKREIIRKLFSYSWPLMFFSLIVSIFHWIDSFAIGYFMGVTAVGIYNAAVPIALLLYFAPELFMQLFLPLINKEFANGKLNLIRDLSKQVGKWVFVLNLPIFMLLISFPGAIINLLFGEQYIGAAQALRLLSVGLFVISSFRISNNLLAMKGKSKLILYNIVATSVLNIILNVILVPKYGINGAAFSTMISYILLSLVQVFQSKRYLSIIPVKKEMINIFLVSLVPFGILVYMKNFLPSSIISLILQGVFFVLAYILGILLIKALDKNDLMILSTIRKRFFTKTR